MKHYAIKRKDNGVSIMAIKEGYSVEDELKKAQIEALEIVEIQKDDLPDYHFRDAWKMNKKKIEIDMDGAKSIHMDRIRKARAEKFTALGFPVKLDPDLEKTIIPDATQKKLKALRDLPKNTDLKKFKAPEELKAFWPKELKD